MYPGSGMPALIPGILSLPSEWHFSRRRANNYPASASTTVRFAQQQPPPGQLCVPALWGRPTAHGTDDVMGALRLLSFREPEGAVVSPSSRGARKGCQKTFVISTRWATRLQWNCGGGLGEEIEGARWCLKVNTHRYTPRMQWHNLPLMRLCIKKDIPGVGLVEEPVSQVYLIVCRWRIHVVFFLSSQTPSPCGRYWL